MVAAENLQIYTLCENSVARPGMVGEWGYSVLIKADGKTILFDTGEGTVAVENALALGVDLSEIDCIVLSHGHHDHTGGLKAVLEKIKKEVPIIAHPDIFGLKYSYHKRKDTYSYAGIPYRRELLESLGARFELTTEPYKITDDIVTSGEEEQTTEFETIPDRLCIKSGTGYEIDPLTDDLSMYIRTDLGLVVLLGCAHRGIINILHHGVKLMGADRFYMVVGGTHLIAADEERLNKTIKALGELQIRWIGASHCTGFTSAAKMYNAFPDNFFVNSAGSVIKFPYKE